MNPFILFSYGLNSTSTVLQGWLWHEVTYEDLYAIKQRNWTKPIPDNAEFALMEKKFLIYSMTLIY